MSSLSGRLPSSCLSQQLRFPFFFMPFVSLMIAKRLSNLLDKSCLEKGSSSSEEALEKSPRSMDSGVCRLGGLDGTNSLRLDIDVDEDHWSVKITVGASWGETSPQASLCKTKHGSLWAAVTVELLWAAVTVELLWWPELGTLELRGLADWTPLVVP